MGAWFLFLIISWTRIHKYADLCYTFCQRGFRIGTVVEILLHKNSLAKQNNNCLIFTPYLISKCLKVCKPHQDAQNLTHSMWASCYFISNYHILIWLPWSHFYHIRNFEKTKKALPDWWPEYFIFQSCSHRIGHFLHIIVCFLW